LIVRILSLKVQYIYIYIYIYIWGCMIWGKEIEPWTSKKRIFITDHAIWCGWTRWTYSRSLSWILGGLRGEIRDMVVTLQQYYSCKDVYKLVLIIEKWCSVTSWVMEINNKQATILLKTLSLSRMKEFFSKHKILSKN
jgi:hypothetical protein